MATLELRLRGQWKAKAYLWLISRWYRLTWTTPTEADIQRHAQIAAGFVKIDGEHE